MPRERQSAATDAWARRHPADDALAEKLAALGTSGFCLWTGAGLGMQIGAVAGETIPSWEMLVEDVERECGMENAYADLPFAERLEIARRYFGLHEFQRELRLRCLIPTARAIIFLIEQWIAEREVPPLLDQLTLLGSLASSVVNFNIESVSSRVIAAAAPLRLKAFHPPVEGSSGIHRHFFSARKLASGEVFLNVFHPHGAIDVSGRSVLTSRDYNSLSGTLGLQIAIHQAFMENVLIIGMSLEDSYLREQIAQFRPQMRDVYWIRGGNGPARHSAWAHANDITEVFIADFAEHWSLFSRFAIADEAALPEELRPIARHRPLRLARTARGLARALPDIFNAAHDISLNLGVARSMRSKQDFGAEGHRLVFAAESGEDHARPTRLPDDQAAQLQTLARALEQLAPPQRGEDQSDNGGVGLEPA